MAQHARVLQPCSESHFSTRRAGRARHNPAIGLKKPAIEGPTNCWSGDNGAIDQINIRMTREARMTMKLGTRGWASSLGSILIVSSLGLSLAACSGEDSADEPVDTGAPSGSPGPASSTDDGSNPEPAGPESVNEGNPNVTGINDDVERPDTDAEASESEEAPLETLEVPATDHCAGVAEWDPEWVQFEDEVLLLVNEFRSQPADCGAEGQFDAAPPLVMDPVLRCSARLHSLDMFERDYFSHDNLDGLDPFDRMQEAGFEGQRMGENIAQGQQTPEEVMIAWMESDGHCSNIMLPQYTLIGIGFDPGAQQRGGKANYWTQNFGTPFAERRGR
jgi:uncharacterized protein YkwD